MNRYLRGLARFSRDLANDPHMVAEEFKVVHTSCSARRFARTFAGTTEQADLARPENPLWDYFKEHREGLGIWKWEHYFEIYHRHLQRFIGQPVNVLEIGVYSGGSLEMWRSYFGDKSHIYGVDIEEVCRKHESKHVSIFIGDQGDRRFWKTFKETAPGIDILIDDGGHTPEQQRITLEEMLPRLNPGGVYVCEDVHGNFNRFSAYVSALARELNNKNVAPGPTVDSLASPFQSSIDSVHLYPYVVVIEKRPAPIQKLSAPKQGTVWQWSY